MSAAGAWDPAEHAAALRRVLDAHQVIADASALLGVALDELEHQRKLAHRAGAGQESTDVERAARAAHRAAKSSDRVEPPDLAA